MFALLLFGFFAFEKKVMDQIYFVSMSVDNYAKKIEEKMQSELDLCTNKIRTYNFDCMQSIKKMNMLGNQQITTMSNYFNESDSDIVRKNNIHYLSEDMQKVSHCASEATSKKQDNFVIQYNTSPTSPTEQCGAANIIDCMKKATPDADGGDELHSRPSPPSQHSQQSSKVSKTARIAPAADVQPKNSLDSSISSDNDTNSSEHDEPIVVGSVKKDSASFLSVTSNTIQPLNSYKLGTIRKMTKHFGIPITLKEGNTRRMLNKEELYNKIVEHLNKKTVKC